jgi:hypothetical protein
MLVEPTRVRAPRRSPAAVAAVLLVVLSIAGLAAVNTRQADRIAEAPAASTIRAPSGTHGPARDATAARAEDPRGPMLHARLTPSLAPAGADPLLIGGWLPPDVDSAAITVSSSSGQELSDFGLEVAADGTFTTVVPVTTRSVRGTIVVSLLGFTRVELDAIRLATVFVIDSRFASSMLDRRTVLPR